MIYDKFYKIKLKRAISPKSKLPYFSAEQISDLKEIACVVNLDQFLRLDLKDETGEDFVELLDELGDACLTVFGELQRQIYNDLTDKDKKGFLNLAAKVTHIGKWEIIVLEEEGGKSDALEKRLHEKPKTTEEKPELSHDDTKLQIKKSEPTVKPIQLATFLKPSLPSKYNKNPEYPDIDKIADQEFPQPVKMSERSETLENPLHEEHETTDENPKLSHAETELQITKAATPIMPIQLAKFLNPNLPSNLNKIADNNENIDKNSDPELTKPAKNLKRPVSKENSEISSQPKNRPKKASPLTAKKIKSGEQQSVQGQANIQTINHQLSSTISKHLKLPGHPTKQLTETAACNNNNTYFLNSIKNPTTDNSQLPQKEKLQIIWALSFTFKNIPDSKIKELAETFCYDKNKLFEHCRTEIKDSGFDESSHNTVIKYPRKCRFCRDRFRNEVMQGFHEKKKHNMRWQRQMQVYTIGSGGIRGEVKKKLKRSVEFYID